MNLRTKLFLTVGSLFLVVAILSFFIPQIFLHRDIDLVQKTFEDQFLEQQITLQNERSNVLRNRLIEQADMLNSNLAYIKEATLMQGELTPIFSKENFNFWKTSAKFMAFNPEIGFLQVSEGGIPQAVIVLDGAPVYLARATPLGERIAWIDLFNEEKEKPFFGSFIGIQTPASSDKTSELQSYSHPYFIYPWESLFNLSDFQLEATNNQKEFLNNLSLSHPDIAKNKAHEIQEVLNELEKARQFLQHALESAKIKDLTALRKWIDQIEEHYRAVYYTGSIAAELFTETENKVFSSPYSLLLVEAEKASLSSPINTELFLFQRESRNRTEISFMVRELLKLLISGLGESSPFAPNAPVGVVQITKHVEPLPIFQGIGFLSRDVFFNSSLFDDVKFYKENKNALSYQDPFQIPHELALIDNPLLHNIFIGSTLAFDSNKTSHLAVPNLLTIGTNLSPILEDLALNDELIVFLTTGSTVRVSFDAKGKPIKQDFFSSFPLAQMTQKNLGTVESKGIKYYYSVITPLPQQNLHVIVLIPQEKSAFYKFKNETTAELFHVSNMISYQLISITLFCLALALLILGFLSNRITKPIVLLANATKVVARGDYSHVKLPDLLRKDEIGTLSNAFVDMIHVLHDREKIRDVLNKVVSKEIAAEILKEQIELGGEDKIITMLFSDIRRFTAMTEHLPPQEVISFLNAFMDKMSKIIETQGGVIDKYVGDEIMALYGAPISYADHATRAITTALIMVKQLNEWNKERDSKGLPPIEVGIGIHTGNVVAGNMGAETRLNYTVLGANVNLAARLCAAAAPMQILISEHTLNASYVKETFEVKELPAMYFKGFSEPIPTYLVTGFKINFTKKNHA